MFTKKKKKTEKQFSGNAKTYYVCEWLSLKYKYRILHYFTTSTETSQ